MPNNEELIALASFIEVQADVRYWEDATVNGVEDEDGTLIPGREGETWKALIDLHLGRIKGWPEGTVANIHYKVCDAGEYWLTDAEGGRIAKWRGCYVPGEFLCHGDSEFGDYIIMKVDAAGFITNYRVPKIDPEEWQPTRARAAA